MKVPVQSSIRNCLRYVALLLLLVCLASAASAEFETLRLLIGKREIPVAPSAVTDGKRVLTPLAAFKSLGVNHAASADGNTVTVIGPSRKTADFALVDVEGTPMVPLREVLELIGADMVVDRANHAASIRGKLTSVEFAGDVLRANLTLPVVCTISTWGNKLIVDVPGSRLATEAKEVYVGGEVVAKVRLGQYDDDTARVVLDLAKSAGCKIESSLPTTQLLVKVGQGLPVPGKATEAQKPLPAAQPFDITGIRIEPTGVTSFDLTVDTSCRASVNLSKSAQPSEVTLFFKGGTLAKSIKEVAGKHDLVTSARFAQGSTMPALARVHLNLARPVLADLKVEENATTLRVKLPDKAGGRLADKLVAIDPGHGGSQAGARVEDIKEKDVNLRLASELAAALREEGAKVIFTRQSDMTLDLSPRPAVAVDNDADFFVSLHCNSNIKPNSVSGIETYYYRDGESPRLLAQVIQKSLCAATGMCDKGARDCGFKVLRLLKDTGIPGVLVECGYLNHWSDRSKLLSVEYRKKVARGILAGLKTYIEGPSEGSGE